MFSRIGDWLRTNAGGIALLVTGLLIQLYPGLFDFVPGLAGSIETLVTAAILWIAGNLFVGGVVGATRAAAQELNR